MKKLVITEVSVQSKGPFLFTGIFEDFRLLEADLSDPQKESLVGNIYAAKVKDVNKGLNGAFLSLDKEHKGFLPTDRLSDAVFLKKVSPKPIVQDEVVLVKVVKDAHQEKDCFLSVKLPKSFPGEWKDAEPETLLYREKPFWLRRLLNDAPSTYEEVVTDLPSIYADAHSVRSDARRYEDDFPLAKVYNIENQLEKALQKTVYLNSGAALVIERSEGFVFVDVNSKKNVKNKEKQEALLAINKEAAKELFFQLRLRNLSGMILVDFIHMDREHQALLERELRSLSKKETVQTEFVDFTGLQLAELTRKRTRKTLFEQIFER
jgi:Ribonuclease G/E